MSAASSGSTTRGSRARRHARAWATSALEATPVSAPVTRGSADTKSASRYGQTTPEGRSVHAHRVDELAPSPLGRDRSSSIDEPAIARAQPGSPCRSATAASTADAPPRAVEPSAASRHARTRGLRHQARAATAKMGDSGRRSAPRAHASPRAPTLAQAARALRGRVDRLLFALGHLEDAARDDANAACPPRARRDRTPRARGAASRARPAQGPSPTPAARRGRGRGHATSSARAWEVARVVVERQREHRLEQVGGRAERRRGRGARRRRGPCPATRPGARRARAGAPRARRAMTPRSTRSPSRRIQPKLSGSGKRAASAQSLDAERARTAGPRGRPTRRRRRASAKLGSSESASSPTSWRSSTSASRSGASREQRARHRAARRAHAPLHDREPRQERVARRPRRAAPRRQLGGAHGARARRSARATAAGRRRARRTPGRSPRARAAARPAASGSRARAPRARMRWCARAHLSQ